MKNFLTQILGQSNANRKVKAIEELAIERGNKSIFPNAAPMEKIEAEKLMMRAIIFSFSLGLLRFKSIGVSKNVFFHGCEVVFLVGMVVSQEIYFTSIWPTLIWMLFVLSGLFLVFKIKNSRNPEAAIKSHISFLIFKTIK